MNSSLTPNLVTLSIHLRATQPAHLHQHMGRAVQALFFRLIGEPLATHIHPAQDEGTHREMPYTVSGLMRAGVFDALVGQVNPGNGAWVRLTALDEPVAAALDRWRLVVTTLLKEGIDDELLYVDIDHHLWRIIAVELKNDSLPGRYSYQDLIERQRSTPPASELTLTFGSATTFRSQSVNLPLPLPYLVFGSLLTRWCSFTQHRLRDLPDEQVDAFIRYHVLISRHDIQTELYRLKQGSKEIGFTGTVTYSVERKSDHLKHHEPELEALLQREYAWFARTIALLAEFAIYGGVGRKTTAGMGIVSRVISRE